MDGAGQSLPDGRGRAHDVPVTLQLNHLGTPMTVQRATWVPRATLVLALLVAMPLPWAHHVGPFGPFLLGGAVVVLGVVGALWAVALRAVGMAVANLVVGIFATPAVVALVNITGGS